jgi:hypothetical protein
VQQGCLRKLLTTINFEVIFQMRACTYRDYECREST